jgi:peptidoglycan hydrolase-like protein with peptidoglycan-binding domain
VSGLSRRAPLLGCHLMTMEKGLMTMRRFTHQRSRFPLIAVVLCGAVWSGLTGIAQAAPAPVNLTSSSCPANISRGESDGCVVELQSLLNQHGNNLTVDGIFGQGTLSAVRIFQSQVGIAVDGVVGPNTKNSLYRTASAAVPSALNLNSAQCPALIKQNENDGCVTELQSLLNQHGAHLAIDGTFGPATLAAAQAFQSSAGLSADGIVGPNTKSTLYNGTGPSASAVDLRSPSCPNLIEQGEIDGCVVTLQSLLNAHGQSLTVDGDFGPDTLAAVQAFQSSAGLSTDGIVGPNTKDALYTNVGGSGGGSGAPAPINLTSPACPNLIKQGESDGCVTELQSLLNQHGYHLAVDGIFGPVTLGAVTGFQTDYAPPVDGVVGPNTKNALYGGTTVLTGCVALAGETGCATGDSVGARVTEYAHWLYDAPVSASQAADQKRVMGKRFGILGDVPYVWGGGHGSSPGPSYGTCYNYSGAIKPCPAQNTVGLDCSGFVRWMYMLAGGIDLAPGGGGTEQEIDSSYLHAVSRGSLQPGDLIFWTNGVERTSHVALYIGKQYVVSQDNASDPLHPYSPARTGTGDALIEAWFTGSDVGYHLLSWHSASIVGYYHVTGTGGTST